MTNRQSVLPFIWRWASPNVDLSGEAPQWQSGNPQNIIPGQRGFVQRGCSLPSGVSPAHPLPFGRPVGSPCPCM